MKKVFTLVLIAALLVTMLVGLTGCKSGTGKAALAMKSRFGLAGQS
ncbi:hypothetical protein [Salmonella enterica]|nr:hypothetical protein [Salmonella enterica]EGK3438550.1 hypothetical protein [Salmonella enterica subsp. enterica serovar Typhimurium]EGK3439360.1 hypothetical protein [Salmonella enterica subsp. enterica serovar Typhimurium]HAX2337630.1 hypothetical protein [Escherichia coli]